MAEIEKYNNITDVITKLNKIRDEKVGKRILPLAESFWEFCKDWDISFFNEKKTKLKELAGILQGAYEGKYHKVMINVTVRSGKSYMLTLFTAWVIGKRPNIPIMRITNVDPLFYQFSKDTKNVITSAKYKVIFPHIELKRDDASVDNWSVTLAKQVTFFGGGMEGTITGKGAEMCIIDDPVKGIRSGRNDKKMDTLYSIYSGDIDSRLDPNKDAIVILLHTRWNKRDLSGRLEIEEGLASLNGNTFDAEGMPYTGVWNKFVYPALINDKSFDEAIYPTSKLLKKRKLLIDSGEEDIWQLLYQQDVEVVDKKEKIFIDNELNKFTNKSFELIKKGYDDEIEIKVIVDPADSGTNNIAMLFFANVGKLYYIVGVIYTDKELGNTVVDNAIKEKFIRFNSDRLLHEKDGSGNLFAKLLKQQLAAEGIEITTKGHTTGNVNKIVRILSASGDIKEKCVFLEVEEQDEHYRRYYKHLTGFNKRYINRDTLDAADVTAALVSKGNSGSLIDLFLK